LKYKTCGKENILFDKKRLELQIRNKSGEKNERKTNDYKILQKNHKEIKTS